MHLGDVKKFLVNQKHKIGISKTEKRKITNACLRFTKTKNGKNLKVTIFLKVLSKYIYIINIFYIWYIHNCILTFINV